MSDPFLTRARDLDLQDPLREFRDRFVVSDPEAIYLDGNSLGRLPKATVDAMHLALDRWGDQLVTGWRDWYDLPERLGAKIASLVGAESDEVLVCDSTSVNLYKLTLTALRRQSGRTKVVTDDANFPSDVYVTAGVCQSLGDHSLEVVKVENEWESAGERIESALGQDTALLSLSHTQFKSGYMHDMPRLTLAAHQVGALSLWDLSHSVGGVQVDLNGSEADLAVGCGYKYVNGGPGAPAFLYVRRSLQEELSSPIWGWFGQSDPFAFDLDYVPAPGLKRFLAGTPPILSCVALEPGIDLLLEAGMEALRSKSVRQTEFLIDMVDAKLAPLGFRLVTPREIERRGSHVSVAHFEAWRINQALIHEAKVIPDFRAPDVLRLGVTPLYTTFEELVHAVNRIEGVVLNRRYEVYDRARTPVT